MHFEKYIQLTLEQQGFELLGSHSYMNLFFGDLKQFENLQMNHVALKYLKKLRIR